MLGGRSCQKFRITYIFTFSWMLNNINFILLTVYAQIRSTLISWIRPTEQTSYPQQDTPEERGLMLVISFTESMCLSVSTQSSALCNAHRGENTTSGLKICWVRKAEIPEFKLLLLKLQAEAPQNTEKSCGFTAAGCYVDANTCTTWIHLILMNFQAMFLTFQQETDQHKQLHEWWLGLPFIE